MLDQLASRQVAAIDIGSGTIKLNVFAVSAAGVPGALELHEIDTQLRRGMGVELTLKDAPIATTMNAVSVLKRRAADFDPVVLAVYATSAVRRAKNPEALLDPLFEELGLKAVVLSEADEGRLNLFGARLAAGQDSLVAVDPGGDSTDCAWSDGGDWEDADFASLPFGSVSLAERYGGKRPGEKIPFEALEEARDQVYEKLLAYPPAAGLKGRQPSIRMNEPMRKALGVFGESAAQDGSFSAEAAWATAEALAMMSHSSRMHALAGEAEGKLDRTPFGYASWAGLLKFMQAERFKTDPWGIKLGAAAAAALGLGPWRRSA